jgi:phage gpG-like protein
MYSSAGLYPIGLLTAGADNRIVPPVNAYTTPPFIPMAYRQPAGSWLRLSSPSNPTPSEQIIKTAATEIADFLKSARNVQTIANSLVQKDASQSNTIVLEKGKLTDKLLKAAPEAVEISVRPDEDKTVEQAGKLIAGYNEMHSRLNKAEGSLSPAVKRSLENAVSSNAYEQIGIRMNGDGTLELDEEKLIESLSMNYEQTRKALIGSNGLAKSLEKATDRFNDVSASSLLNRNMLAMQQFATYQSSMQVSLQIPTKGLLVNGII